MYSNHYNLRWMCVQSEWSMTKYRLPTFGHPKWLLIQAVMSEPESYLRIPPADGAHTDKARKHALHSPRCVYVWERERWRETIYVHRLNLNSLYKKKEMSKNVLKSDYWLLQNVALKCRKDRNMCNFYLIF